MKPLKRIPILRLSLLAAVSLLWSAGVAANFILSPPDRTQDFDIDGVIASITFSLSGGNGANVGLTAANISDITITTSDATFTTSLGVADITSVLGSAVKDGSDWTVSDFALTAIDAASSEQLVIGADSSSYTAPSSSYTPPPPPTTGNTPVIGQNPVGYAPPGLNQVTVPEPPLLALILAGLAGITGSRMLRRQRIQST